MKPRYYMEYVESKKTITESFKAYYKFKNLTTWKPFKVQDVSAKAEEKAGKRYAELRRTERKDRLIRVEFFEEYFVCKAGSAIQEYRYDEIEGIYETDTTIAFVAGKDRKKDAFQGLKKGAVKGKSLGDLKDFVVPRCKKLKHGVKYI